MKEERYITEKGTHIYGIKNPASHGFFASLFVSSGSMHEGAHESGITHFLEHVLIKNVNAVMNGTLYETLDKYGIEFNAGTYSEMVQFYISGSSANSSLMTEILTALLSEIKLSVSDISAERERVKAEIREASEKTTLSGFTLPHVYNNTSLSRSITGSAGSVSKITLARLSEYRRLIFSRDNIFFYLTGNYTDQDVLRLGKLADSYLLSNGYKTENTAPVPENFLARVPEVYVKNADYFAVRFTFDIDTSHVSLAEADLLYDVLLSGYNSRFFIEMSEKRGLFYDVSGALERYRNIGTLNFTYELRGDNLYSAIEKTVEILNSLKSDILPDGACMKAGYTDNAYMLFDDNRELNFTFAYDNHIMNANYSGLEERKNTYRAVSAERIREIAGEVFLRKNLTFTMKGRKAKTDVERIEEILKRLG